MNQVQVRYNSFGYIEAVHVTRYDGQSMSALVPEIVSMSLDDRALHVWMRDTFGAWADPHPAAPWEWVMQQ